MTQVFADDFTGALDTSVWEPGWGADAAITGPMSAKCLAKANVSVSSGQLHLRVTQLPSGQTVTCGGTTAGWEGGLVDSQPRSGHPGFTYKYGYVEWRARTPQSSDSRARIECPEGYNNGHCIADLPQLWSMDQNHNYEIDTMEGMHGKACSNTHPPTPNTAICQGPLSSYNDGNWHTFGSLWTASGVDYYYDGALVAHTATVPTAQFLVMDIIDGAPLLSGATLDVDSVRVWQADGDQDGVPDNADTCPGAPGPAATQGCPDGDGDGVADMSDSCPSQAGPVVNHGCPVTHAKGDYVGDGKADFALYRPSGSVFLLKDVQTGGVTNTYWGSDGDTPFTGDFVGDEKNDLVLYRRPGSYFLIKDQQTGSEYVQGYGSEGDRPITGDFVGSSKDELALYRSAGSYFLIKDWAEGGAGGAEWAIPFGSDGDRPITGDFVGSSKNELALYRAAGSYFIFKNWADGGAEYVVPFGSDGDKPISGDFVGSSKTELALYREAGSYFLIKDWADGGTGGAEYAIQFGQRGDIPVPADYIGDSKTDIAVFRPSTNELLVRTLDDPTVHSYVYGSPGDVPIVPYGSNY